MVLIKLGIEFPLPLARLPASADQQPAAAAAAAAHPHGSKALADPAAAPSAPLTGGSTAAAADADRPPSRAVSSSSTFAQRLQRRADGSLFFRHDKFFPSVSLTRTAAAAGTDGAAPAASI